MNATIVSRCSCSNQYVGCNKSQRFHESMY